MFAMYTPWETLENVGFILLRLPIHVSLLMVQAFALKHNKLL